MSIYVVIERGQHVRVSRDHANRLPNPSYVEGVVISANRVEYMIKPTKVVENGEEQTMLRNLFYTVPANNSRSNMVEPI